MAWPHLATAAALLASAAALASPAMEARLRLDTRAPGHAQDVALTLDACGGAFDAKLIDTLVQHRIPATLFVTRRWLARNAAAVQRLKAHPDLFEFEDHGAAHVPLVIGRRLYGLPGVADRAAAQAEVQGGREAIAQATGAQVRWFRGAGAAYDSESRAIVAESGLRLAGFSVNGDDGARLGAALVARRLAAVQPGDVVLAHMNHPGSGTAAGIAQAVPVWQQRGLRFVRLSQAAGVVELPAVPRATTPLSGSRP